MELAFVCLGKKSVSAESVKYFPDMFLVLGNIVRINEDIIQIDDDTNVDHICKNVIHNSLERLWGY